MGFHLPPKRVFASNKKYHSVYPNTLTNHKTPIDKQFSVVIARNETFNARNVVFVSSANTAHAKPEECRVTLPGQRGKSGHEQIC